MRSLRASVALALVLLAGCGGRGSPIVSSPEIPGAQRRGAAVPTGIVIPMYANPGSVWDQAISGRKSYPNVPMLLIADVTNTGAGGSKLASYAAYIAKAQAAGISVIGYIATGYGHATVPFIETQMNRWYAWYKVDGIFLDEMNPSDPSLYTTVTAYAHAHALPLVMGNPGENAAGNSGPDVINYYEQRGYPSLGYLKASAHLAYGKSRWSYMAGAVPFDAATITESAPYVAYLYVTDGTEPECYCKLPSYFTQLLALLGSLDSRS
jgi:hypothetical protein